MENLNSNAGLAIVGRVEVLIRPRSDRPAASGPWQLVYETPNLITTAGKVLVAKVLMDESGFDTGLTWIEVGTGSTTPGVGDTALVTPTIRKAVISSPTRTGNVVEYRAFFPAADISVDVKESGIFGHSTASSTNGTGELFARALVTFNNAADPHDATFVWTVTLG